MTERDKSHSNSLATWPWLTIAAGVCILLASLVYIPSNMTVLNYFDPPKRLLWALAGFVLIGEWSLQTTRLGRTSLLLSMALLVWIVARTLLKPNPSAEIEVLFTWMLPVLLFILASAADQKRGIGVIGRGLVFTGLIQAALMILQRHGLDPLFPDTTLGMTYKPGRMIGTIGYQNQAVDFLALSASGIFMITRHATLRLIFLIVILLVAGFTGNRGGILAFTLAMLASQLLPLWHHDGWSARKKLLSAAGITLGFCGMLAALLLIPETGARFREAATGFLHSTSADSRILMSRIGVNMFCESPWSGWGAGEYARQYLDRLGAVLPFEKTHAVLKNIVFARETHNDYLQFAIEFGFVGLLLAAALFIAIALRAFRTKNDAEKSTASAVTFILVYMGISSLFSFPWQTSMGGALAGFLLGLFLSKPNEETPDRISSNKVMIAASSGTVKPILVVSAFILLGWFALDFFLNASVPATLAQDGPAAKEPLLPHFAYRYHAIVGAAYANQGADVEAERELSLARQGYQDISLLNNLGHVKAKMHKWSEASEVYEIWAKSGLDYPNALMNLSIAYEQTGQLRKAADALAKSDALFKNLSPLELKRLAVLQFRSGDAKNAQATLQQSMRRWSVAEATTVAEIENLSGAIWMALGQKQEAAKNFRSALGKNPALESAKRNLQSITLSESMGTGN